MTIYVCQCPHLASAKVWTAQSEREVIDAIVGSDELSFETAIEAAQYDMRDAYCTEDALDLWLWINGAVAPRQTRARTAFLNNSAIRVDVESLAQLAEHQDDLIYTAFDGEFSWSDDTMEWRLGNQPTVPADDLVEALCAASLVLPVRDATEMRDA